MTESEGRVFVRTAGRGVLSGPDYAGDRGLPDVTAGH